MLMTVAYSSYDDEQGGEAGQIFKKVVSCTEMCSRDSRCWGVGSSLYLSISISTLHCKAEFANHGAIHITVYITGCIFIF